MPFLLAVALVLEVRLALLLYLVDAPLVFALLLPLNAVAVERLFRLFLP